MRARSTAALAFAFLSSACGDPGGAASSRADGGASKPVFGEPSLVRMQAAGGLRYEMAIALSGIALDRVLEPVTASLDKAVGSCPDVLARLGPDEIATVRFSVASGTVERADDSVGRSEDCLANALVRGGVATKETFEAWVQLRKPPGSP